MEEFKPIKNYENSYQISNFGRIKSIPRNGTGHKEKILKFTITNCGYYRTCLSQNDIKKYISVHRLVAEMFVLDPLSKPHVNHKDGNKLNNNVDNLEWVTCSENHKHAFKLNLRDNKGDKASSRKLTSSDIREIRGLKGKVLQKEIAKKYNITQSNISKIFSGVSWGYLCQN